MDVQRTITICIADDPDLRATLTGFQCIQQRISAACYNDGKPLSALALHRAVYEQVKGTISSQMTCTAIRLVASSYASAKANKKPAQRPFEFKRPTALFLIGERGRDARSVRRLLKRLGRKQRNRTRTFCQHTAATLVKWARADSVLVFERLTLPQTSKKLLLRKGTRRRLSQWQRRLIHQSVTNAAEWRGLLIDDVNPAYTSQDCSRCGLRGVRKRHAFTCPHCGHSAHADVNAATNIRLRYTALRLSGPLSTDPEALSPVAGDEGKLPAFAGSR